MKIKKQFFTATGIEERELMANESCPELKAEYEREKNIEDNLPSLSDVRDAVNGAFDKKQAAILLKIIRVIYSITKD